MLWCVYDAKTSAEIQGKISHKYGEKKEVDVFYEKKRRGVVPAAGGGNIGAKGGRVYPRLFFGTGLKEIALKEIAFGEAAPEEAAPRETLNGWRQERVSRKWVKLGAGKCRIGAS